MAPADRAHAEREVMATSADLSGKVMFITGAGRGIGAGIAEVAAQAGCDVAINALTHRHVDGLAARISADTGRRALGVVGDVATPSGAAAAVGQVLSEFGRIDVLVNNLGDAISKPLVALPGDEHGGMTDDEVDLVMRLNLTAAIACTRAAGPQMIERRSGKVVNISSFAALGGGANMVIYATAKTALTGFTRALALEWAPFNIQVNAVAPGVFPDRVTAGDHYGAAVASAARYAPAGRAGDVREIGHAVVYLASGQADYITGQTLPVDGGVSLR
jgi:NAD(P)-dependent dehydrogenase (short-subunit alcohol dehydrogenase family)